MKLGVVIVSFNVKDLMASTLSTLKTSLEYSSNKLKDFEYEVIVVDNNSTDGVVDLMKKDFNWVTLIENNKNLGFSKANNQGVATLSNADYVLFLNNDVRLDENTISECLKYIQNNSDIGILTCKVDLYSGGLDWDCHRAFPTVWNSFCYFTGIEKMFGKFLPRIFGQYHLMYKNLNETHEIDLCLGAFMLIPYKIGEEINWWPTDYFLNGEDVDFCYQIKKILEYKIVYYPNVKIVHYKGASKGTKKVSSNVTKADDKTKVMVMKSSINAMEIFYNKYYASKNSFLTNLVVKFGMRMLYFLRRLRKKE